MKYKIDTTTWKRREHYEFFNRKDLKKTGISVRAIIWRLTGMFPREDTNNCGKGKKQHTDCNKYFSERAKGRVKCALCQLRSGQAISQHTSRKDNQRGQRQNNKGIDENTHHGN